VAVGLLSLLCSQGRAALAREHAAFQDAALDFEHARGKTFVSWGLRVFSISPEGFWVDTRGGAIEVVLPGARPALNPGDRVTVAGRLVEPHRFEATSVRLEPAYLYKRGLNYVLSSATVLVFLYLIRRRFRLRLHEGLFRSRY
jgi:hypothetical protein